VDCAVSTIGSEGLIHPAIRLGQIERLPGPPSEAPAHLSSVAVACPWVTGKIDAEIDEVAGEKPRLRPDMKVSPVFSSAISSKHD